MAQADPQLAAEQEAAAREARRVVFGNDVNGTTDIWASLASRDAKALNRTLSELAVAMGESGDDRSHDQRRATALGMLSDPAAALSWLSGTATATEATADTETARARRVPRGRTVV